jgi:hypothetical protein
MHTATSGFLQTRFFSQRAVFPPGQSTMGIKSPSWLFNPRSGEAAFEKLEKLNSAASNPIAAILEPKFGMDPSFDMAGMTTLSSGERWQR